ncbi:MAG: citrate synthase [Clostridia bacterium]|nr:citrate synthase [Clostridia bacterium]
MKRYDLERLSELCLQNDSVDPELYSQYDVKKGLRDINGKGVVAGLTNVSFIRSSRNGEPCEGRLFYRGKDINELVSQIVEGGTLGYERIAYLLIFGKEPDAAELAEFNELLASLRQLPKNFVRDVVMKAPSDDIMLSLSESVLMLSGYDKNCLDISLPNVLEQCLRLISLFPQLAVYGYHAYNYYINNDSMYIHYPEPGLSAAQNLLMLLRPDRCFTALEAAALDIALILHMEHGGGNNSTFTMRVVTSSGTDTYSAVAAALGSLKGPRHGGANVRVTGMMNELKSRLSSPDDEAGVRRFFEDILDKKAYDRSGLIYGMGHAVYSVSDPRAGILKEFARRLSVEKGRDDDYRIFSMAERIAPEIISERRRIYKGVSANVDFYSGFVYELLNIPPELYTPIFAVARIVGWSAHRLEELVGGGKIIRPAYIGLCGDE